jgi:hypothetical protein
MPFQTDGYKATVSQRRSAIQQICNTCACMRNELEVTSTCNAIHSVSFPPSIVLGNTPASSTFCVLL